MNDYKLYVKAKLEAHAPILHAVDDKWDLFFRRPSTNANRPLTTTPTGQPRHHVS